MRRVRIPSNLRLARVADGCLLVGSFSRTLRLTKALGGTNLIRIAKRDPNVTDRSFEDYDDAFENGVLRDGAVARVKMTMGDALPPDRPLTMDEVMHRFIERDTERRKHLHVDATTLFSRSRVAGSAG
jgi:hypothetical protein